MLGNRSNICIRKLKETTSSVRYWREVLNVPKRVPTGEVDESGCEILRRVDCEALKPPFTLSTRSVMGEREISASDRTAQIVITENNRIVTMISPPMPVGSSSQCPGKERIDTMNESAISEPDKNNFKGITSLQFSPIPKNSSYVNPSHDSEIMDFMDALENYATWAEVTIFTKRPDLIEHKSGSLDDRIASGKDEKYSIETFWDPLAAFLTEEQRIPLLDETHPDHGTPIKVTVKSFVKKVGRWFKCDKEEHHVKEKLADNIYPKLDVRKQIEEHGESWWEDLIDNPRPKDIDYDVFFKIACNLYQFQEWDIQDAQTHRDNLDFRFIHAKDENSPERISFFRRTNTEVTTEEVSNASNYTSTKLYSREDIKTAIDYLRYSEHCKDVKLDAMYGPEQNAAISKILCKGNRRIKKTRVIDARALPDICSTDAKGKTVVSPKIYTLPEIYSNPLYPVLTRGAVASIGFSLRYRLGPGKTITPVNTHFQSYLLAAAPTYNMKAGQWPLDKNEVEQLKSARSMSCTATSSPNRNAAAENNSSSVPWMDEDNDEGKHFSTTKWNSSESPKKRKNRDSAAFEEDFSEPQTEASDGALTSNATASEPELKKARKSKLERRKKRMEESSTKQRKHSDHTKEKAKKRVKIDAAT